MAEYTRGLDNRENERSGHNNSGDNTRRRTWGVDFNAVNYEQRRPPYGSSSRETDSGMYDNGGNHPAGSPNRRDDA